MEGAADMAGDTAAAFMAVEASTVEASTVEVISAVDGSEEAASGEDSAITRTEDMLIRTRTIPILTGIGQLSATLMAGAIESGFPIIEDRERKAMTATGREWSVS